MLPKFMSLFFFALTLSLFLIKHSQASLKKDGDEPIKTLVSDMIKDSINRSVMESANAVRDRLSDALEFVEKAIKRARNCTNCIENYLGVSESEAKNQKDGKSGDCKGDDCLTNKDTLEDLDDIPSVSRLISVKKLDDGKPKRKSTKKPKSPKQKTKLVKPKKEQSIPAASANVPPPATGGVLHRPGHLQRPPPPISMTNRVSSTTPMPSSPPASGSSPDNYGGSNGQCLSPCQQSCAPDCTYDCCQSFLQPPPSIMAPPGQICPSQCLSNCYSYCQPSCCGPIPMMKRSKSLHKRMILDHMEH